VGTLHSTDAASICFPICCCTTSVPATAFSKAPEPGEIRTPALWGLRFRRPFLHDGSATTIADAIERHAGEAELVRRGFQRLTPDERMLLLAFLRSL
jgi:CxxC motif-containing protein (DUF1111 family)